MGFILKKIKSELSTPMKLMSQSAQLASLTQHGFDLHQQGKIKEAQSVYEQVLKIQPHHFDALQLLGTLSLQIKQFSQAADYLSLALQLDSEHAACYANRGIALKELKRLDEALLSYDQAISLNPSFAEAHAGRGDVLQELKRLDEALLSYDRAISIKPASASIYYNRGNVLQASQRLDAALSNYSKAIALKPDFAEAHYNFGNILKELKFLDPAINSYDQAIKLKPNFAEAHYNRGNTLKELGHLDKALSSYEQAIHIKPDYAEAYCNRGNALQELGRLNEALLSYEQAISINPNYAEAYSNLGNTLQELKRLDEALSYYAQAIRIKPSYAEAHWNLSLCNLLRGNLHAGWQGYEWRWQCEKFIKTSRVSKFSQPLWLGEKSLKDKTILLYAEQGYGDTIQFSRYVSLVAQQGATVILEVQRPLVKLLRNLEGVNAIFAHDDNLPNYDYQCPLLSLPLAFHTEMSTIPVIPQQISADKAKLAYWRTKLGDKIKPRVGIAWSGSAGHKNDHRRSLTLSQFAANLPSNCEYISLQKEMRDADRVLLAKHPEIKHFGDLLEDFTDTAALCELMDVVISVDTSVAHLAGTFNKPTCILLPYSPDWRWLLDRIDSPWYPTARLYRQLKMGDWSGVLENLKRDLEKRLLNKH